jgi:serine/threonine protein kinase/Tol biopolymer transport system component
MPIEAGQTIGRYRIEEKIGAGGMGVVYRAYDEKLERDLAIKILAPGALDDEAARKRFRNEAYVLSRLNHPAIQTIHDFDSIDGHDLLVSEFVRGVSLDTRVVTGPLPEKDVVRIGVQLTEGLAAAHAAGVLHRDLKPANLRVTPEGLLKILDFGLATLSRQAVLSISTTMTMADAPSGVAGTLPYMAPEQLLDHKADERSDLYSAGCVLYELSTGELPFAEKTPARLINAILHDAPAPPRQVNDKISAELERITLKCLEKDPELRYQSAKELVADLKRLELEKTRTVPAVQRVAPRRSRSPVVAAAAALIAMVAAVTALLPRLGEYTRTSSGPAVTKWEQLTNFTDSASVPAISPDGKVVAFIRGRGRYGGSATPGQIWFKTLPDGESVQLTDTPFGKQTLAFSPDGTRVYFTQIEGRFTWNTYEVSLLGGQPPRLLMSNATGLSRIGKDGVLFSELREGIHMSLATSNLSRTEKRAIYVPPDATNGMVHRSALSPDGKWVLAAEMDSRWWVRCRLLPFDGSSMGREVGPEGACTAAQWSPDGQWMYLTVDSASTGFHIWRQRFPDGVPEQLTPRGATEEEGLAVLPDGKSLITAAGAQESSIWLHDHRGNRQITSEGFAFLPTLSPDGKRLYYLRRTPGSRFFLSGELYVADVDAGRSERLLPGLILSHYALSHDGKKLVCVPEIGGDKTGIWLVDAAAVAPPRQITSSQAHRAFFGAPGEVVFEGGAAPRRLMRISEDGTDERLKHPQAIMQLMSVSPDGGWAVVGVAKTGGHGDGATLTQAFSLTGGEPVTLCDECALGFGSARMFASFATWSHDGKWIYLPLRYFQPDSTKTLALPVRPGSVPAAAVRGVASEEAFARLPGARLINESDVAPGIGLTHYAFARASAKTNLFRIYLPD